MSVKPEKKAVLGILAVVGFAAVSVFEIGKRNLWFEPKDIFYTHVKDADGLRIGGLVTISGLRVGDVASLDVDTDNRIKVTMEVKQTVAARLRTDTVAIISRAFIIGDKRIELTPGNEAAAKLRPNTEIPAREATDLSEFLSGHKLAEILAQIEALVGTLSNIATATDSLLGGSGGDAVGSLIARVEPLSERTMKLMEDMLVITGELRKKKEGLPTFLESGANLFTDVRSELFVNGLARNAATNVNKVLDPIAARQPLIEQLLVNLDDLSRELRAHPQYGGKMIEAADELILTLRAMQKTWFLEDQTREVKQGH